MPLPALPAPAPLSLVALSWVMVAAYIVHFAEEAPRLVRWFAAQKRFTGLQYTLPKLIVENAVLFSFVLATAILITLFPANTALQVILFGHSFGFLGNFFFHAWPTIKTGVYSPGVVSASTLFPAVFFLANMAAHKEGLTEPGSIVAAMAVGTISLPIAIALTHKLIFRRGRVDNRGGTGESVGKRVLVLEGHSRPGG